MAKDVFGGGSFEHELWISNKKIFHRPTDVNVEFVSSGDFEWIFADVNGNEVRTLKQSNPTGLWHSVNLPSLGLHGDFSIGFRNDSPGPKTLKQGDVLYG